MTGRSTWKVRAATFALLPVLLVAGAWAASHGIAPPERRPAIAAADWQPRPGDVILTAADDMLGSRIASASGDSAVYSHIGVVVEKDGRPAVIESSPLGEGHVAYADLAAFTTDPNLSDLLILRPAAPVDGATLSRDAAALAAAKVPFDFALDMSDDARIYCAELAYKLLARSGVDMSGIAWIDADVPLSGRRRLVTPDAFARLPGMQAVYRRAD